MRLFNSFQITAAFVAWPFGLAWLSAHQDFAGASAAMFAAATLYVVAFGAMVACVWHAADDCKF